MRGGREGEEGTQRGIAVRQQTKALFEVSVERRNVCVCFLCVCACVCVRECVQTALDMRETSAGILG